MVSMDNKIEPFSAINFVPLFLRKLIMPFWFQVQAFPFQHKNVWMMDDSVNDRDGDIIIKEKLFPVNKVFVSGQDNWPVREGERREWVKTLKRN